MNPQSVCPVFFPAPARNFYAGLEKNKKNSLFFRVPGPFLLHHKFWVVETIYYFIGQKHTLAGAWAGGTQYGVNLVLCCQWTKKT